MKVNEPFWIYIYETDEDGNVIPTEDDFAMVSSAEYLEQVAKNFIKQGKSIIIGEGPVFSCSSPNDVDFFLKDIKQGN